MRRATFSCLADSGAVFTYTYIEGYHSVEFCRVFFFLDIASCFYLIYIL